MNIDGNVFCSSTPRDIGISSNFSLKLLDGKITRALRVPLGQLGFLADFALTFFEVAHTRSSHFCLCIKKRLFRKDGKFFLCDLSACMGWGVQ